MTGNQGNDPGASYEPINPSEIYSSVKQLIQQLGCPESLRPIAEQVSRLTLPPPEGWGLLSAATWARRFLQDRISELEALIAFLEDHPLAEKRQRYSRQQYSAFYVFDRFAGLRSSTLSQVLARYFAGHWAEGRGLSVGLYYSHILAVRSTLLAVRDQLTDSNAGIPTRESLAATIEAYDRTVDPLVAVDLASAKSPRSKIALTLELLNGDRQFGGRARKHRVARRSSKRQRARQTTFASDALTGSDYRAESNYAADDGGSYIELGLRPSAPQRDRSNRTKDQLDGFARRNVRSCADMASLALPTFVDFLDFADREADDGLYSLVWLSGVAGLDVNRPMEIATNQRIRPKDDQILVSPRWLRYRILRRSLVSEPGTFESTGVMWLPVPLRVRTGLDQLLSSQDTRKRSQLIAGLGRKFTRRRTGLAPTARRLRASAWRHIAMRGLSELEFAALSGRVSPSLMATSHYYPTRVRDVIQRFAACYQWAATSWKVLSDVPLVIPNTLTKEIVHAKPVGSLETLGQLMETLSELYVQGLRQLKERKELSLLLKTVNIGQLAVYFLQEFGGGLRPTGDVARMSVSSDLGAMTCDKGSSLFSERSFSPLSSRHARALAVARTNRDAVSRALELSGTVEAGEEDNGDLACFFTWGGGDAGRSQITGSKAREYVEHLKLKLVLPKQHNWGRRLYLATLQRSVPSALRDEMAGHRRVGREALSKHSTIGLRSFDKPRRVLDQLHAQVIPAGLLTPVADAEHFWFPR